MSGVPFCRRAATRAECIVRWLLTGINLLVHASALSTMHFVPTALDKSEATGMHLPSLRCSKEALTKLSLGRGRGIIILEDGWVVVRLFRNVELNA